ncbi:KamA family radical SAM protein [Limnothrix redekei]|uniref:Lysine 2,3-aminomutase n=1 Tax=Limnothrix redekei LRLZ20PSL1 TaxID=3112953 RepID=A0ABW7CAB4_9CYAN
MKPVSTIASIDQLVNYLDSQKVSNELCSEIVGGIQKNSMALRLTHHVLRLIDWRSILQDPIRKQFLPLQSEYIESHPKATQDSLTEKVFQPQDGLIHRYPDKVLFLVSNACPAYCSFCTRSYAIGPNTDSLTKYRWTSSGKSFQTRVKDLKEYLEVNSNVTDILLSGGDIASVEPQLIDELLNCLSNIQSLQTIRLATRTLLFEPSLFFFDTPLFRIITRHAQNLKKSNRELSIQSHFNHPFEISLSSRTASLALNQAGVTIRNQTVLLDGVNATFEIQKSLIENLWISGIQPYYVYQMDMVSNVEHFRTKLSTAIDISKQLTGVFAGFKLPRFIVDLPSGGGKRSVYEYEFHDREHGIYGFRSPCFSDNKIYYYYDPLRYLDSSTSKGAGGIKLNF